MATNQGRYFVGAAQISKMPGEPRRMHIEQSKICRDREGSRKSGRSWKIALINAVINALIDYEPDRNQWGVADQWTAPFINKKGAFETGHGDCEDYALAKYVALRQAGVRSEDVRMVLVHDYAVRVDHAILAVRYDNRWLILDNRWDKLVEDNELKQFKPLAIIDAAGATLLAKQFTLNSKLAPAAVPERRDPDNAVARGLKALISSRDGECYRIKFRPPQSPPCC